LNLINKVFAEIFTNKKTVRIVSFYRKIMRLSQMKGTAFELNKVIFN